MAPIDIKLFEAIPEYELTHVFRAGGGPNPKDYTVLSVAVTTLGLILVVELIRHKLDHAATGRVFFKTVLDGVYRECK